MRRFRAKVKLVRPGQNQIGLLFLVRGVTRNYYKSETKEWTSRFGQAGDFVVSMDSFLFHSPSHEFIETCTPIECIEITKTDYLQLLADYPDLKAIVVSTVNKCLKLAVDRMRSLQMQSATDRYHLFVQTYPDLYKQVQLQHIASYLGITPHVLSRIRNQYKRKKLVR